MMLKPAFFSESRPFLPTARVAIFLPLFARKKSFALRRMLELKAPARPRSPLRTIARIRSSGRRARSGCRGSSIRDIVERNTRASSFAYGRAASAASCARRSRAAATNFIARVICWVFFTERMRRRKSRREGMGLLLRRRREALLESVKSLLDFGLDGIVEGFLVAD